METVSTGAEPVKRERDLVRVYRNVNEAWGRERNELPVLDGAEAIAAVRALWRFAARELGAQRQRRGMVYKLASGNRHTWPRNGVYYVNPDNGWWTIVHSVSHRIHQRVHPGAKPHDAREAYIERQLIEHVVSNGWLDGKLKQPEKPKKERNAKAERHQRAIAGLSRWTAKRKRAETAIKKLTKQVRYYERQALN